VGLALEDVDTFYGHLVYFTSILCTFGIFDGHLENFTRFGQLSREKSGNPEFGGSTYDNV
jgi:hypothetical protein